MALPKYMTRDAELSTTGIDRRGQSIDQYEVARRILHQVPNAIREYGGSFWKRNTYGAAYSMDCHRNWLSNGQCYYSDMSHVEACTAEVLNPHSFAAQCHSTLLLAERSRQLAELDADDDARFSLSASNADVFDPKISWGTHLNVSVTSQLWEDLFTRHNRPALLGYVSSAIAAGIAFFGQGYLLPLKDGVVYSTAGRTHQISELHTRSTVEAFGRGILNERREPHAENSDRLHLIGFDFALAGAAMMCSYVQCLLTAAEEGFADMILLHPVRALRQWSWCLDMQTGKLPAQAVLIDGRELTLPQYIRELTVKLLQMVESGLITADVAPQAGELLPQIIQLADDVAAGAVDRSSRHLDWAAKLLCILGSGEPLDEASTRLLDHDYSNTCSRRGSYWRMWADGLVDPLIDMDDCIAALKAPPEDSRAWARGNLIDRYAEQISDVNWDHVELRRGSGYWGQRLRIELPALNSLNRQVFEPTLNQANDLDGLEDLLDDQQSGTADPMDDVTDFLESPNVN